MIISFDPSVESRIINGGGNSYEFSKINFLLEEMSKHHLHVEISFDFAKYLLNQKSYCFSDDSKILLAKIIQSFATIMSISNDFSRLINIVDKTPKNSKRHIEINLSNVPDIIYPSLFCENIEDSNFYLHLYKLYRNQASLFIKADAFNGNNMASVRNRIDYNDFLFCVCDSDKQFPSSPIGKTAQNLIKEFSIRSNFSDYYILGVHEKENLFPGPLVCTQDKSIKCLMDAVFSSNDDCRNYFDLKEGLDQSFIIKNCTNPEYLSVYIPVIKKVNDDGFYDIKSKKHIKGLGSKAIEKFSQQLHSYNDYLNLLTELQKKDILNIFKGIETYGFAYFGDNM